MPLIITPSFKPSYGGNIYSTNYGGNSYSTNYGGNSYSSSTANSNLNGVSSLFHTSNTSHISASHARIR